MTTPATIPNAPIAEAEFIPYLEHARWCVAQYGAKEIALHVYRGHVDTCQWTWAPPTQIRNLECVIAAIESLPATDFSVLAWERVRMHRTRAAAVVDLQQEILEEQRRDAPTEKLEHLRRILSAIEVLPDRTPLIPQRAR